MPTPTHREVISAQVRRLVADVYGWSFGGTKEHTRINWHLPGRYEITERISQEIGVSIPDAEWPHLLNVGKVIDFVHMEIQREYAAPGG